MHHPGICLLQGVHHRAYLVRLGLSLLASVLGLAGHEFFALVLQDNVGAHLFSPQLILAPHGRCLGLHLGFLNLALLHLHGNLRVELVLPNGPLVLYAGHAALGDGVIGRLEVGFTGFSFQRAGNVGRGFDGYHGHPQDLKTQGLDLWLAAQLRLGGTGHLGGGLERIAKGQTLDHLLHDGSHLHHDPPFQAVRIFRGVGSAIGFERKVHHLVDAAGVPYPVGDFTLDRHSLEVAGDQLKHESGIPAGDRHRHQGGGGCVVEEGQTRSLAHELAAAELHEVGGGLRFDELDAKHLELLAKLHSTTFVRLYSTTQIGDVKHGHQKNHIT